VGSACEVEAVTWELHALWYLVIFSAPKGEYLQAKVAKHPSTPDEEDPSRRDIVRVPVVAVREVGCCTAA
jgi:hypothetical protein